MALGSNVATVNPNSAIFKGAGYVLAYWGGIKGIGYCLNLNRIYHAIRNDAPFGVQGCSTDPTFAFFAAP